MYGLITDYFTLTPKTEANVYFVRKNDIDKFAEYVRATIKAGRVPKAVLFGDIGLGKTHTLYYLSYFLQDVAKCIYVEVPPFHRRSKFTDLYSAIMRKLGGRYWIDLLNEGVKLAAAKGTSLEDFLQIEPDLASMIQTAIKSKDQMVLWRYLAGERMRSSEAQMLSALTNQINQEEAIGILNAMSILVKQCEKKQLLLLFDEIEHTNALTGDSMSMFREAIRDLVDESSRVGSIFAGTGRALEDLPIGITDDPVRRRVGYANYIYFKEYSLDELRNFIMEAIKFRRKPEFDVQKAIREIKRSDSSTVPTIETYPFDPTGIDKIIDAVVLLRDSGKLMSIRPTEALSIMDRSLTDAVTQSAIFVEPEIVSGVCDQLLTALGAK